jgi:formamidase
VQTAPVSGDVEATWKKFADQVRGVRAVFPHVSLVVFPELYLAAVDQLLDETHEYAERVAVTVPGDLTGRLGELARETGLWLVPGSVYERGPDGKIFNSALAFDPSGRLVASYRKCFPSGPRS